jgi:hypothetical protein
MSKAKHSRDTGSPGWQPISATLLALCSCLITACVASTIPRQLSPEQMATLEAPLSLPLAVGVDAPRIDTGTEKFLLLKESDRIIRGLRGAGIFRAVDYTHRFSQAPDLRATAVPVERVSVYQPYFTLLTLGLFPACISEIRGYSFSLRSVEGKKSLDFDYAFKGYRCGGWFAFLLNLHPRWSFLFPTERLDQQLRLDLVSKTAQIQELCPPDRTPQSHP